MAIALATGGGFGLLLGLTLKTSRLPALQSVPLVAWPVAMAVVGVGVSQARRALTGRPSNPIRMALWFGVAGWLIGTFGVPRLGGGTRAEAIMALVVPGLALGYLVGSAPLADIVRRAQIDQRSRVFIFLGPALLFISASLIIPSIITVLLSFPEQRSQC